MLSAGFFGFKTEESRRDRVPWAAKVGADFADINEGLINHDRIQN